MKLSGIVPSQLAYEILYKSFAKFKLLCPTNGNDDEFDEAVILLGLKSLINSYSITDWIFWSGKLKVSKLFKVEFDSVAFTPILFLV